jgi:hypothetical protein
MLYLRLIRPNFWDARKKRFVRVAFRNSSAEYGGGISVVDRQCAEEHSGTTCAHLGNFYDKFKYPIIIWQVDSEALPAHEITPEEAAEGVDPCHRNLVGIENAAAEELFRQDQAQNQLGHFLICNGNGPPEPADQNAVDAWTVAHA